MTLADENCFPSASKSRYIAETVYHALQVPRIASGFNGQVEVFSSSARMDRVGVVCPISLMLLRVIDTITMSEI